MAADKPTEKFEEVFEDEEAPKEAQSMHRIRANSSIMQLKKILGELPPRSRWARELPQALETLRGDGGLCWTREALHRSVELFANATRSKQLPTVVKSVSLSPCHVTLTSAPTDAQNSYSCMSRPIDTGKRRPCLRLLSIQIFRTVSCFFRP